MSHELIVDPALDAWLRAELDAVQHPTVAVERAIAAVPHVSQRRSLRQRLRELRERGGHTRVDFGPIPAPEITLWPEVTRSDSGSAAPAVARSSPTWSVLVTLITLVVITMAMVIVFWGSGAPLSSLIGGADPQATDPPALVLEEPTDEGREIIVDAIGNGHAWTIGDALSLAVDGDTITIRPGTYRETIIVTKDVSIEGGGEPGDVILELPSGSDLRAADEPFVVQLRDTAAQLRNLTIRGPSVGTSLAVTGGEPLIEGLVIDPAGRTRDFNPAIPRHGVTLTGGTGATLRDTTSTAYVAIDGASTPTLDKVTIETACIRIEGSGSAPELRDVNVLLSECPQFSISVTDEASPRMLGGRINNVARNSGVVITGAGSSAVIDNVQIQGGRNAVWVGNEADATVIRTNIFEAETGIAVSGAHATLSGVFSTRNGTGLSVDRGATIDMYESDFCENDTNIHNPDGLRFSTVGSYVTSPCGRVITDGEGE